MYHKNFQLITTFSTFAYLQYFNKPNKLTIWTLIHCILSKTLEASVQKKPKLILNYMYY